MSRIYDTRCPEFHAAQAAIHEALYECRPFTPIAFILIAGELALWCPRGT